MNVTPTLCIRATGKALRALATLMLWGFRYRVTNPRHLCLPLASPRASALPTLGPASAASSLNRNPEATTARTPAGRRTLWRHITIVLLIDRDRSPTSATVEPPLQLPR
jgi:hypothetical protein